VHEFRGNGSRQTAHPQIHRHGLWHWPWPFLILLRVRGIYRSVFFLCHCLDLFISLPGLQYLFWHTVCLQRDLHCHIWFSKRFILIWPPLWASGQGSWLQIQIFWDVAGLERGPLSLVSTTEELLERKSSGSFLEIPEYGRRDQSCWPRFTFYPQKLAITSPTSGCRSIGIVRSQTQATEFSLSLSLSPYRHISLVT
jgi:hypothetical protein